MPARNTDTSYGSVSRSLHWLTALLIFAAFPLGLIANGMAFDTAQAAATKAQLFSVHKTLGVAVFFVALARILWAAMQAKPAPMHPDRKAETLLADTVHWALYLALVVVPLSGWVRHAALDGFAPILWPFGQGLPFVPTSDTVAGLAGATHWLFTKLLFAAVALHVLGALKHVFVDRDLTLARMTRGASAGVPGRPHATPLLVALAIFAAGGLAAWQIAASRPPEAAPASGVASGGNWRMENGNLTFAFNQMGTEGKGSLPVASAEITFDETTGTGHVSVQIDTARLAFGAVTEAAKGPEFFDVATHPGAVFVADITPSGSGFDAKGTLSLRGREVPVTLPFTLGITGDTARMQGVVTLDRRDFDLGVSYVDEKTVGFAVKVTAELTATRVK